jgi:hypothetical protein
MSESHMTIQLTNEQRKQLAGTIYKSIETLSFDLTGTDNLSEKDLEKVIGGILRLTNIRVNANGAGVSQSNQTGLIT